ncbi:MAG: alpha/beta fold hydrolase [Gemmatimonadota bacterium]
MAQSEIDLTVYPDECDAFGHLNQAAFLSLFERARWEMLARGPGMNIFTLADAWPAVRKTAIDYHAPAFPGDVLRFQQSLIHHGRTSFTMRQTARRVRDDVLIATAEFVFVCVSRDGRPVPVPEVFGQFMAQPSRGAGHRLTVNGVGIATEVRGEGPPLVFIHGYPLSRLIWEPQLDRLAGVRRVAPDLRGLGLSDAPDLGYSMAIYADDLIALMDTLDIEQAVLCGLSMGGYVAFEVLRRARHRIRGLVLMSTRAEADSAEARRGRDAAALLVREQGAGAIADSMLPRMLGASTTATKPELVAQVRRLMAASPVAGIAGALTSMRDRSDSISMLPELGDIPTLIVAGAEDTMIPLDSARRMAQLIPGARFSIVPEAGHLVSLEQPEAVSTLLSEFLSTIP